MRFLDTSFFSFFSPPLWYITFRWENIYMGWVSSVRLDNLGNFQDHFVS